MINFENTETFGWEAAIRGMRNPMNSWEKSDSEICDVYRTEEYCPKFSRGCPFNKECGNSKYEVNNSQFAHIGQNDLDLMKRLSNAGTDHRKFMRMIAVYVDITAPLYW